MHWAIQYLGVPWENGAQGPAAYDCWNFFRHVQRTHYGLDIAPIFVDADDLRQVLAHFSQSNERQHWLKTLQPVEGNAVLMYQSKYPSHVGVWLDVDGGGVLHCVRGAGVVFSDKSSLQLSGWSKCEYYFHASHA